MSDNELKPCPLCGGDVRITYLIGMGMDTGNWIECPACNRSYIWADHIGRALWNTRPIEDALRARIAELEAAVDAAQIDEVTRLAKQAEWARAMLENEQLKAEVERLRNELAQAYNAIHDMDNARMETRRIAQSLLEITGNAYRVSTPPEAECHS